MEFLPVCYTGFMEAWDVIETQHSPIMTVKVQEGPLHCLSAHPEVTCLFTNFPVLWTYLDQGFPTQGFLVCVGGDSGDASLLELSNSLVTCTKAEKVCKNLRMYKYSPNPKEQVLALLGSADC